ncbi:hypothetical protein CDAR_451721 [Caerostris darwini]|uniref:Uncharacterized protein n=1 Tax=Caerostris darwini TaxID=1538125 RepID=A0AAV4W176_9ARAC|nr:hypothetical protein CDAR_451721 [Caerostris darwini]
MLIPELHNLLQFMPRMSASSLSLRAQLIPPHFTNSIPNAIYSRSINCNSQIVNPFSQKSVPDQFLPEYLKTLDGETGRYARKIHKYLSPEFPIKTRGDARPLRLPVNESKEPFS